MPKPPPLRSILRPPDVETIRDDEEKHVRFEDAAVTERREKERRREARRAARVRSKSPVRLGEERHNERKGSRVEGDDGRQKHVRCLDGIRARREKHREARKAIGVQAKESSQRPLEKKDQRSKESYDERDGHNRARNRNGDNKRHSYDRHRSRPRSKSPSQLPSRPRGRPQSPSRTRRQQQSQPQREPEVHVPSHPHVDSHSHVYPHSVTPFPSLGHRDTNTHSDKGKRPSSDRKRKSSSKKRHR